MRIKDMVRPFDYKASIHPAQYTATETGDECDITGHVGNILGIVRTGAIATADGSNYFTLTVTEASATGGSFSAADSSQYDAVDSFDYLIDATAMANNVYAFQFKPSEPFIKAVLTKTAGSPDAFVDVTFIFQKRTEPAST